MNMSDKTMPQNVEGVERVASVVGGLLLVGNGLRTGGLSGMVQVVAGGMGLFRGVSGHCQLKQKLCNKGADSSPNIQRYSHMPLDSEVRSPDFEGADVQLPDTTPMGHENQPGKP